MTVASASIVPKPNVTVATARFIQPWYSYLKTAQLYCQSRRGHWWDRLALNLDAHLGRQSEVRREFSFLDYCQKEELIVINRLPFPFWCPVMNDYDEISMTMNISELAPHTSAGLGISRPREMTFSAR